MSSQGAPARSVLPDNSENPALARRARTRRGGDGMARFVVVAMAPSVTEPTFPVDVHSSFVTSPDIYRSVAPSRGMGLEPA